MSYKQYVPQTSQDWDTYWTQTSIEEELNKTKTDGLLPIFKKYLKKSAVNIEAGCGLGKWVLALKNMGYSIVGLDTYTKGLKLLKRYDSDLQLQTSDVQALALKNNSIDSYISLGVVEHFEAGPQKALAEAYRVLKPGGLALIEIPFDSPLRILSRHLLSLISLLKLPARIFVEATGLRKPRTKPTMVFYEYRYTKQELHSFCTNAGFDVTTILPKDEITSNRSIMLWSDLPFLRHPDGQVFHLNSLGAWFKRILDTINPSTYSALIVAICYKPK